MTGCSPHCLHFHSYCRNPGGCESSSLQTAGCGCILHDRLSLHLCSYFPSDSGCTLHDCILMNKLTSVSLCHKVLGQYRILSRSFLGETRDSKCYLLGSLHLPGRPDSDNHLYRPEIRHDCRSAGSYRARGSHLGGYRSASPVEGQLCGLLRCTA